MKPYYESDAGVIYNGDALEVLKSLPDESVHCCVTSPPYWGLRDYGIEGQLGLEKTPEEYIENMVQIFREVRRVLRNDGTLFLNLGDSYFGSKQGRNADGSVNDKMTDKQKSNAGSLFPLNVQHEVSCGTSGKEPEDYQDRGCLCENLCGVCREVYRNHKFHNNGLLVSMLIASLSLPTLENTVFENGHSPTLDFSRLENHILIAIQDFGNFVCLEGEQLDAFRKTMPDEFSQQLLDLCWQRGSSFSCLLCGRSLIPDAQVSGYMLGETLEKSYYTRGSVSFSEEPASCNQNINKACDYCISYKPQSTINNKNGQSLKPKDLCGIPWRVALALQSDGWYLRSDIIWNKPNPMPESVTDRPTKSHEYLFLLTKSAKYFYDNEAIKEPAQDWGVRDRTNWSARINAKKYGQKPNTGGGNENYAESGRNKRSVWTIPTKPFSGAHFAVFPPALIEPCILAGTSEKGCCAKCGSQWERIIERYDTGKTQKMADGWDTGNGGHGTIHRNGREKGETGKPIIGSKTIGWQPTCKCDSEIIPCTTLDPFFGSGTAGEVSYNLDRKFIGIELSKIYLDEIAIPRIERETSKHRQIGLFN